MFKETVSCLLNEFWIDTSKLSKRDDKTASLYFDRYQVGV